MVQVADAINPNWNITDRDNKFENLGYQIQDLHRLLPNVSTSPLIDILLIVSKLSNALYFTLPDS